MPFGGSFWAVPKRCDLNEMRGMLQVYYNMVKGKKWYKWNNYHQELVARRMYYLKKCDKLLSTKSIRVIKDEAQFFGFTHIDQNKRLIITKAGELFINSKKPNEVFKNQFLKLQLTNPSEERYIKEINVFPFRVILQLLIDLKYLTPNEAGLYVFTMKNQKDLPDVEKDILNFRKMSDNEKANLINQFKKTTIGRKLLVLAPYVGYAWSFFLQTGLLRKDKNGFLRILEEKREEIENTLLKFKEIEPGEFENINEWFQYFGNPKYLYPPQKATIKVLLQNGSSAKDFFLEITGNGIKKSDFTSSKGEAHFNLFKENVYDINFYSPEDYGKAVFTQKNIAYKKTFTFKVPTKIPLREEAIEYYIKNLNDLVSKKRYDEELQRKLNILRERKFPISKIIKFIRGGRFEQLIYKILDLLKEKGIFDEVIWNGKEGKYGIPQPAEKVSTETKKKLPDIIAQKDNYIFIIETTLLRGRAQWEKPEAVSVPDHIEDTIAVSKGKNVFGIFIAEKLDKSVEENLINRAITKGYKIVPIELKDFLEIIKLQEQSPPSFWISHFNHIWEMQKRIRDRSITSS